MQTRRDQAQAFRFAQIRARTALISGEPDARESLLRRSGTWSFAGAMLAVLLVAGFGIFGLIRPGGKSGWDTPGVLVLEKETGARFVYDESDHSLHPVLNYASARLMLGQATVDVRTFSRKSLDQAPRGTARGLAGLPDSLPTSEGLVRSPWLVCNAQDAGSGRPAVTVSTGLFAGGPPVGAGQAVLVHGGGDDWLLWNGHRLRMVERRSALSGLGYDGVVPLEVDGSWLNALPAGPDLAAPSIIGLGRDTKLAVGDRKLYVGQLLKVPGEGGVAPGYYLTEPDGLQPVSETVALLLLADPDERYAYGGQSPQAFTISRADVAQLPVSTLPGPAAGLPSRPPTPVGADVQDPVLCATYGDHSGRSVDVGVSVQARAVATAGLAADTGATSVRLPPGRAALVRLLAHPGQTDGPLFLVADSGTKYPVASDDALSALGLAAATPVALPVGIASLIPTGPALDSKTAGRDATWSAVATPVPSGLA